MIHTVDTADAGEALRLLSAARERREVLLVLDPRMPPAVSGALRAVAAKAEVPDGVTWAALSGGTSGSPRIVLRTEASWQESFASIDALLGKDAVGGIRLPAPPSSSLTLFSLAHALAGGPRPSLEGTALHATPYGLVEALDGDFSGGSTALVGGAFLDPGVLARAAACGVRVVRYYGAAELSFVAVDTGDGLKPFPGVEIALRGTVVWVRSPYLCRSVIGPGGSLERDGAWASVGDRAQWRDGGLHLLGRKDDAVLSAGATIVPEEVEAMLQALPGVRDAAVFATEAARVGSLLAALVDTDQSLSDLRASAREKLSPSHLPRRWFRGSVPRTLAGKVARGELERAADAGELSGFDVA